MGRFWTEPAFGGHDTGRKPAYDARFREEVRTALEEEGENIPTKKRWPERACAMRAAQ
ncbi:hypothetical protein AWB67_06770 [Caballeronia terrestris]|uniref:Uncharacterized protein n=1 Tax=Caballeronia terrestris TaxID=1226301 RepID=A0A158KVP7_9BURK|nr:hypothetical protein AWB67_06770 [Caballeronia terrestris]